MNDHDVSEGHRFSRVYLASPNLLPDSKRMRRRLGHAIGDTYLRDFGSELAAELGIFVDCNSSAYSTYWPPFVEKMELRDVLDAITIRYRTIRVSYYDETGAATRETKTKFLTEVKRIFIEEGVRYRLDNQGGVHFTVDAEFERARISTLSELGRTRYSGVNELFESSFSALDATPPDGKAAIRAVFFAAESLFRLMFPSAPQLNAGELQRLLKPKLDTMYAEQRPAVYMAQKQLAAFKEWIDAAHFYRHEPGTEEPAQPPLDLAINMIGIGAAHLRWLARIDSSAK